MMKLRFKFSKFKFTTHLFCFKGDKVVHFVIQCCRFTVVIGKAVTKLETKNVKESLGIMATSHPKTVAEPAP
jgi:hypothetical protein